MPEIGLRVPALEKLVDYVASGVGAIAGPMMANWRANKEGKAKLTSARYDADALQIESESRARTIAIISDAQAEARHSVEISSDSSYGTVEITREDITQSIEFQSRKRLANVRSVMEDAADDLGDKEVIDHEPNHDWTARFFNYAQDVSSEEIRKLWSKVLAGEVERPGSVSIKTLDILKNLDKKCADLFRMLSSVCVTLELNGLELLDARVPNLGGYKEGNSLQEYGLGYDSLDVLREHGLVSSDLNSWFKYTLCILPWVSETRAPRPVIPFGFQGQLWVLSPTTKNDADKEFKLTGVALTRAGWELSKIVELEDMAAYAEALAEFFRTKNLIMTKVNDP